MVKERSRASDREWVYQTRGGAVTNPSSALPAPQPDLARSLLKDPYIFDFLGIREGAAGRELKRALIEHIRDFLLEIGLGFAFIGNQYRLSIGGREFSIDLLFYHLKIRSYVVIELKIGEFIPEYAGMMNFSLSAVDDLLRYPDDNPRIGIIRCKSQNRIIAEYALRDMEKLIGVAGYELTPHLPEDLRGRLPTVDELEEELGWREG